LREALEELNYRNLDELPQFAGHNTTTEALARAIFDRIAMWDRRWAVGNGRRRSQFDARHSA
jgi:hypothetical protein